MSTRAATASASLRAKQELVRLLFGGKYRLKGPEGHRMLDHSIYSYNQLRSAYLERIQVLHPDKRIHCRIGTDEDSGEIANNQFVELQEAWNRYEELAKMMKRVAKGDQTESSFTMFGVGCSFSDNEFERTLRTEIMDQAGRGWFSAGSLGDGLENAGGSSACVTLSDDDMFEVKPKISPADDQASSLRANPPSLLSGLPSKFRQRKR